MTTAPTAAPRVVAPTYQLLKTELAQAMREGGLLPDAEAALRIEAIYQALRDFFADGTPVTAVYMHQGHPVEVSGTVIASQRTSNEEPSFTLACSDGELRDLPGSLLARAVASARALRTHWRVGTVLRGTEQYPGGGSSTTTIRITYVSDQNILAVNLDTGDESSWSLVERDWQEVAR